MATFEYLIINQFAANDFPSSLADADEQNSFHPYPQLRAFTLPRQNGGIGQIVPFDKDFCCVLH